MAGTGVPREAVDTCKVSWGLDLELAKYYFHHILVAKAGHKESHKDGPDPRGGEIDSTSYWRKLQGHTSGACMQQGEEL